MLETFILLLCGHLIGDFLLQTGWIIRRKKQFMILCLHVVIVTLVTALVLGSLQWEIYAIIFVTHLITDVVKTNWFEKSTPAFFIDQNVHIGVLAVIAILYPETAITGWLGSLDSDWQARAMQAVIIVNAIILTIPTSSIAIGLCMNALLDLEKTRINRDETDQAKAKSEIEEIDKALNEGLSQGGAYIGGLERILALLLVLGGEAAGVGFLIAAKSILRFGELQKQGRRVSEYIIIGTMMSFTAALVIAFITKTLLTLY